MNQSNLNPSSINFNKGKTNGNFKRALDFSSFTKEAVACTNNHCNVDTWRIVNIRTRFCGSSFHIHSLLGARHLYSWNIRFLPRQCCMHT